MGCQSSAQQVYGPPSGKNITAMQDSPKGNDLIVKYAQLIKNKEFSQVIKQCRRQVQRTINEQIEIDGMGNLQQATSYYEWDKFQWYVDGIAKGMYKGTVYDLLSLCQLELRTDQEEMNQAIEWYRGMIDFYPQKYQILYGYANILYSKTFYQEAIDFYNRVIQLRPTWTMPVQCIAFTHEYKRVQLKKANELANKLLQMQPNNRVAMFILARNEKDVEIKIQKLKEASQAHPLYARAINEIGIVYGGTKKEYREAISWYKKCIQIAPKYAQCYNNVGVNHQLLKQYDDAIVWYFRAIERDKEYKAPHTNASDCFDTLQYTDQQIEAEMAKYNIYPDFFYYYLGLAYYDKRNNKQFLKYYQLAQRKADLLKKQLFKLYNSIGITYYQMKNYPKAIQYYTKCIQLNPKYHSAYYNAAIVYKNQDKIPEAIDWYQRAIKANHRYSYAYNNLGDIYKNSQNYEQAIKNFRLAVKHLSTYTLAYANMGICYLKLQQYREAFNAMTRANELLPTDNNNLSSGNKQFLAETLKKFNEEGESWSQNGGITQEQREKLSQLIKSFEANFRVLYHQSGMKAARQKILKSEITEIIKLINEDKFQLKNIYKIYDLVKVAFKQNEEYFHILPQFFLQYFMNHTFKNDAPVLQTQNELRQIVKALSTKTIEEQPKAVVSLKDFTKAKYQFKLKNFDPPSDCNVNLFENTKFFRSYQELYAEIIKVNQIALAAYKPFKEMVDRVRKQSYGIPYGVGMKIPKQQQDQFKVILRIFQKMFKKEINTESVKQIITKIEQQIKKKKEKSKELGFTDIVLDIMNVWTQHISDIVKERRQENVPTTCQISDLLRGKVMFESLDRLKKALQVTDQLCLQNGYQIIQMDNRLAKPQTQDVVLKIKVQGAICQFQLAMEQDETQYHFVHAIYQIERSPLGCIFGSYIYLSKRVNYHIIQNCKDIVELLGKEKDGDAALLQAAKYIVETIKLN